MYRIMIVEDDRSVAEPLRSVLQSWGFEADIAENFENLTAEFQRIRPDLILMDLYQPDKTGFTGLLKSGKFPPFQSFSFPVRTKI